MTSKARPDSIVIEGLKIEATHPCLAGHFPGNPIVPAVVLLDEVQSAIRQQQPGFVAGAVPVAKFLSPLLPDETFSIRLEVAGHDVRFECFTADRVLAKGSMQSADNVRDDLWKK